MADDQETSNDMGDENQGDDYAYPDGNDPVVQPTTTVPPPPPSQEETQPPPYEPYNNNNDGGNVFQDEYDDDEPLPDVTVNLVINGDGSDVNPDGLVTDIVNAGLTDEIGKLATTTPSISDAIEQYTAAITQGVFDEIQGNGTVVGEKGFWGSWGWHKILVVILIALCIIGIIVALICCLRGRPSSKGKPQKLKTNPDDDKPLRSAEAV